MRRLGRIFAKTFALAAISAQLVCASVFADVYVSNTVVVPEQIHVGNQVYGSDLSGLSAYLDTLRTSQPALVSQLQPDLDSLVSRRDTAITVMVLSLVTGAVLSVGSLTFLADQTTIGSGQAQLQTTSINGGVFAAGMAIAVGGTIFGMIELPHRTDLLNFINKHNQLNPNNPMSLTVGLNFAPNYQPELAVVARF